MCECSDKVAERIRQLDTEIRDQARQNSMFEVARLAMMRLGVVDAWQIISGETWSDPEPNLVLASEELLDLPEGYYLVTSGTPLSSSSFRSKIHHEGCRYLRGRAVTPAPRSRGDERDRVLTQVRRFQVPVVLNTACCKWCCDSAAFKTQLHSLWKDEDLVGPIRALD